MTSHKNIESELWAEMLERVKKFNDPGAPIEPIDFEMHLHDQAIIDEQVMDVLKDRNPSTVIFTLSGIVGLIAGAAANGNDEDLWAYLKWANTIMEQGAASAHQVLREEKMSNPLKRTSKNPPWRSP